jgi:hypothetical protein
MSRGGARSGTGPKPLYGAKLGRMTLMLTDEQKAKLKQLGGNAWLRAQIDAAALDHNAQPRVTGNRK